MLSTKVAQCAINLTTGCTAGSLTACRLRTFVMAKIYHTRNNFFLFKNYSVLFLKYILQKFIFLSDESRVLSLPCFALKFNFILESKLDLRSKIFLFFQPLRRVNPKVLFHFLFELDSNKKYSVL